MSDNLTCTKCGGHDFLSSCVKCRPNIYDQIRELEAQLSSKDEVIGKMREALQKIADNKDTVFYGAAALQEIAIEALLSTPTQQIEGLDK